MMTHDEFMRRMRRPTFVWLQSWGLLHSSRLPKQRIAALRMERARAEIDALVLSRAEAIPRRMPGERGPYKKKKGA